MLLLLFCFAVFGVNIAVVVVVFVVVVVVVVVIVVVFVLDVCGHKSNCELPQLKQNGAFAICIRKYFFQT